jgi:predicted metal-dependent hydrolase
VGGKALKRAPAASEARSIALDGREVAFSLRRSARRTLALQVGREGVRIAAPQRMPIAEIERFLRSHSAWLKAKLDALAAAPAEAALELADGARFPLLGAPCRLRLAACARTRWQPGADGIEELHLAVARDPHAALLRALKERALPWLAGRVEEYCHRLGVATPPVRLSSARTRWGSCSSRSGIRLHWRLIHLTPALADYVVAHEVAHLREMNHSPRFWAVVERLYPDWKAARARLRAAARELPVIGAGADRTLLEEE